MNVCGGLVIAAACNGFPRLRDLHGLLPLTLPSTKVPELISSINEGVISAPTLILESGGVFMSEVFGKMANIGIDGYHQKFNSSFPKHFWRSSSGDETCTTTGKIGMRTFPGLNFYSDGGKSNSWRLPVC